MFFLGSTSQLLHLQIEEVSSKKMIFLTVVYAKNRREERVPLWQEINNIASSMTSPWAVIGDLNCVAYSNERIGGLAIHPNDTRDLLQCMQDSDLQDIKAQGCFYTWSNRNAQRHIMSKLDRCLVNGQWLAEFPYIEAEFMPPGISDHSPILLTWINPISRGPSPKH